MFDERWANRPYRAFWVRYYREADRFWSTVAGHPGSACPGALAVTDGSLLARGEGRCVATISLDEELYEPARTQRRRQAAGR